MFYKWGRKVRAFQAERHVCRANGWREHGKIKGLKESQCGYSRDREVQYGAK